jgi:citrate synthase
MVQLITARAAAERLGVDVRTLYAYVSRGALTRVRLDEKRRSLYDSDEVELLARRRRPRTNRRSSAGIDVTIGSAVSTIERGRIRYRGHDLSRLLDDEVSFEDVAELIWSGTLATLATLASVATGASWSLSADVRAAAAGATGSLDGRISPLGRMAVGVAAAAPLLSGPAGDLEIGRQLVALLAESAGYSVSVADSEPVGDSGASTEPGPFPLARRLWARLSPLTPTAQRVRALNRALVVLADHELATSTLAARIAASTRADLPACLLAALGTLDGDRHGGASDLAHQALLDPADPDLASLRQFVGALTIYPNGDPRGAPLLDAVGRMASASERAAIDRVLARANDRDLVFTVDFALGALCFAGRMPPGSARAIFATARCAGWIAHIREELDERPLRFRGRAVPRPAM